MNYLKGQLSHLKKSVSWKNICITAAYDLLFYGLLIAVFYAFTLFASNSVSALQNINPSAILSTGGQNEIHTMQNVLTALLVSILLLYISFLALHSLFQALIWGRLIHKKVDYRTFFKVSIANLIYYTPMISILLVLLFRNKGVPLPSSVVLFLFFLIHFGSVFVHQAVKEDSIKKGIINLFWKGCMFHRFIFAYALIFAGLFIIVTVTSYAKIAQFSEIIPILFMMIYLSWARSYFAEIMR